MARPLLILDLDETLVFATNDPPCDAFTFQCSQYFVYARPNLVGFLDLVEEHYDLAVWTSSGEKYAECIVSNVLAERELEFVWARERCTRCFDAERHEEYWVKDLRKVRKRGYKLERVLVVDDTPKKLERSYGNLVQVTPWEGQTADEELLPLGEYLVRLQACGNFRRIEKRGWRSRQLTKRSS